MKTKLISLLIALGMFAGLAVGAPDSKFKVHLAAAKCHADNVREYGEIVGVFNVAKKRGNIDPTELKDFQVMDERLKKHEQFLAKDGFSPADCTTQANDLRDARGIVTAMANPPPGLKACQAKNLQKRNDIFAAYNDAKSKKKFSLKAADGLKAFETRMNALELKLAQNSSSVADCRALNAELEKEQRTLDSLIGK